MKSSICCSMCFGRQRVIDVLANVRISGLEAKNLLRAVSFKNLCLFYSLVCTENGCSVEKHNDNLTPKRSYVRNK